MADIMRHNIQSSQNSTFNILELCEIKYDPGENILDFYDKFKGIVCDNLKKKGDQIGFEEIQQDEVLSPTFEEVIILWCLHTINPNLPSKVKPTFNQRLKAGLSITEFKDDIFQYFSENDFVKEETSKLICDKCKEYLQVTKKDPDQFPVSLDDMLDIKQDIDDLYSEDDIDIKGERETNYEYDPTEPYIQINGKEFDEDFSPDNSEDYNDSNNADDKKGISKKVCSKIKKHNKPTKCDICLKTFAGERRLKEHMQRKHDPANKKSSKTLFSCKPCKEAFNSIDELKKHRSEAHKPGILFIKHLRIDFIFKSFLFCFNRNIGIKQTFIFFFIENYTFIFLSMIYIYVKAIL